MAKIDTNFQSDTHFDQIQLPPPIPQKQEEEEGHYENAHDYFFYEVTNMLWVAERIKDHFFKNKTRGSMGWNTSRERMWQELQDIISRLHEYKGVFHNKDFFDAQVVLSDFYWIHQSLVKLKSGSGSSPRINDDISCPDDYDSYENDSDEEEKSFDENYEYDFIITKKSFRKNNARLAPKKSSVSVGKNNSHQK